MLAILLSIRHGYKILCDQFVERIPATFVTLHLTLDKRENFKYDLYQSVQRPLFLSSRMLGNY